MPSDSIFDKSQKLNFPVGDKSLDKTDDDSPSVGLAATVEVSVAGQTLNKEIHSVVLSQSIDDHHVLEVIVDADDWDAVDSDRSGMSADMARKLMGGSITATVKTENVGLSGDDEPELTFVGVVTRIRFDSEVGGLSRAALIAHSPTIRLDGNKRCMVFQDLKPSEAIDKVIGKHQLSKGTVDAVAQNWPYLLQHNQTDYEFVMELANRNGLFGYYDGQKFHVVKEPGGKEVELQWLENLGSFSVGFGSRSSEVIVRGWDYKTKKTVIGESSAKKLPKKLAQIGDVAGKKSEELFSTEPRWIDLALGSEKAVLDAQAQAEAGDRATEFVMGQGQSSHAVVQVGKTLKIAGTGKATDGKYLVTRVVHRIAVGSYSNSFECTDQANAYPTQKYRRTPTSQVFTAIVTDNADPEELGRVKVKAPWSDEQESWWARVIAPGNGPERGGMFIPEVGDEVAIVFDRGNPEVPLVLGGLWNGKDKPPLPPKDVIKDGKVEQRVLKTRTGLMIRLDDTDRADTIQIVLVDGKTMVELKGGSDPTITINSEKHVKVNANESVMVEAKKDLTLKSGGNMKLDAGGNLEVSSRGNTTVKATGNLEMSGSQSKLQGQMATEISGGAKLDIKGSGILTIQGSMVKIN